MITSLNNFILSVGVVLPLIAFAHGGGQTIQQVVGDYTLSLDAVSAQVHSGDAERMNVEIERNKDTATVPFSDVWLRITGPNGEFLFSGNLENKEPLGLVTGVSYFFPIPGTYEVAVRFLDGEKIIAETTFALPVLGGATSLNHGRQWQLPLLFLLGFGLGSCLFLLRKKTQ